MSEFANDIANYLREHGVTISYNKFREEVDRRCDFCGLDKNQMTIIHPVFVHLIKELGGHVKDDGDSNPFFSITRFSDGVILTVKK